jgi:arginyl-tRNA synthetase
MKENIIEAIAKSLNLDEKRIGSLLEVPKDPSLGDYALPCFTFAKDLKKNPVEIAKDFATKINSKDLEKVIAVGPYVNMFLKKAEMAAETVKQILRQKDRYGSSLEGKGKVVAIDLSAPNIAKPFGIGHLRSTIIGTSIANIGKFLGYKPIKINYLGDWGTQFGKLIVGYKKFGDAKKLRKDPINHLLELYVKVNQDENLEEMAREEFRKLEQGDKKNLALWKSFRNLSLKEFDKIYKILGVKFDVLSGESLYNKKMEKVVEMLDKKSLLKESEGAQVVDLSQYDLGVCLIKKSDGATLYATRDLAAAIDRYEKYKFHSMVYEVGSEQTLHFRQFFKILELLGFEWSKNCVHVGHGLYLDTDGKKFSTRKGKTVFMADILLETINLAKKEIQAREKVSAAELEKRSKAIALAAILYGDLRNYREQSVVFDIDRFLQFEGNTGPYLLYTYARAQSILRKSKKSVSFKATNVSEGERNLVNHLAAFPNVVREAYAGYAPNVIANYAYDLSQKFNEFYHAEQVIGSENESFKLALVKSTTIVLKNALSLLGIPVLDKM